MGEAAFPLQTAGRPLSMVTQGGDASFGFVLKKVKWAGRIPASLDCKVKKGPGGRL